MEDVKSPRERGKKRKGERRKKERNLRTKASNEMAGVSTQQTRLPPPPPVDVKGKDIGYAYASHVPAHARAIDR